MTRFLGPLCSVVALGFEAAAEYLPRAQTVCVGTPVREQFLQASSIDLPELPIPPDVPLIVVVGGSQGAVAVNQLIRTCAPAWLEAGAWIVHQTGDHDPNASSLQHPHYFPVPFYNHMAALFRRATLVISRAGAGTLTELAIAHAPSILIPYPFAAEDHQTLNAEIFVHRGAARLFPEKGATGDSFGRVLADLLADAPGLQAMAAASSDLAPRDAAIRVADALEVPR